MSKCLFGICLFGICLSIVVFVGYRIYISTNSIMLWILWLICMIVIVKFVEHCK